MKDYQKIEYLKSYVESVVKSLEKNIKEYNYDLVKGCESNIDIDRVEIELDVYQDILDKLAAD